MNTLLLKWMCLKERLRNTLRRGPNVNEGDIWWASIGENIGWEINGKSESFSRPVIIVKKLSQGFFLVIPATTKERHGSWYVTYSHKGISAIACLHQIRAIDYRRLRSRIGQLQDSDLKNIKTAFIKLIT